MYFVMSVMVVILSVFEEAAASSGLGIAPPGLALICLRSPGSAGIAFPVGLSAPWPVNVFSPGNTNDESRILSIRHPSFIVVKPKSYLRQADRPHALYRSHAFHAFNWFLLFVFCPFCTLLVCFRYLQNRLNYMSC